MQNKTFLHSLLAWAGAGLLVAAALIAFIIVLHRVISVPREQLQQSVKVGMTKSEVIARLGKPAHTARSLKELDRHTYNFNYMPLPTAPVEKELLEYYRSPIWKLYIYIDKHDRVNRVLLANT